jgi:hypothetical protein
MQLERYSSLIQQLAGQVRELAAPAGKAQGKKLAAFRELARTPSRPNRLSKLQ